MALYIIEASRTAFGSFSGKLKDISAIELGRIVSQSVLQKLSTEAPCDIVDNVVFGNVLQTSQDAAYLARHIGLKSKINQSVPAVTVNRLCGSGFEAMVVAAMAIQLKRSHVALIGGTESMSQAPFALRGIRDGIKFSFGSGTPLEDTLSSALVDTFTGEKMGDTAENIAIKYGISRKDCDLFAQRSHKLAKRAVDLGIFRNEITKVPYKIKKEALSLENDEGIRENVTFEKLGELSPVFAKEGKVTAGNSSGISDGASALIIASQEAVEKYNIEPLAEIVDWEVSGVDPSFMGLGPVPAIKKLLARQKMTLKDINHIEVNEAFAAQVLGVCRELGLEADLEMEGGKINPHGGAIAIGHPLGASGARLLTTVAHSLSVGDRTFGLASACIGGGQGYAVLLKKVGA